MGLVAVMSALGLAVGASPAAAAAPCENYTYRSGESLCADHPGPADVDCGDLSGPVQINGSDPWRLDRDDDGTGCETAGGGDSSRGGGRNAAGGGDDEAAPVTGEQLPRTGVPASTAAVAAGGLLLLGSLGVAAFRRRRVRFVA